MSATTSEVVKLLVRALEASEKECAAREKLKATKSTVTSMELMADVEAWSDTAKRLRKEALEKARGWRA